MDDLLKALDTAAALYAAQKATSAPELKKPWMSRPLPWAMLEQVITAMAAVPEVQALTHLRQLSLASSKGQRLSGRLVASALIKRAAALGEQLRPSRS